VTYGITLGYEKDICSICGLEKEVRIVFKKDKKDIGKVAYICDSCVEKYPELTIEKLIEEKGKSASSEDIKIISQDKIFKEISIQKS